MAVETLKTHPISKARVVKVSGRPVRLFKVLVNNSYDKNWTGGNTRTDWSPYIPTDQKPGKPFALSTKRQLSVCNYGLHVSNRPSNWGANSTTNKNVRLFEVKVFGPVRGDLNQDNKICAYKVQLIREIQNPARVTETEWSKVTNASFRG